MAGRSDCLRRLRPRLRLRHRAIALACATSLAAAACGDPGGVRGEVEEIDLVSLLAIAEVSGADNARGAGGLRRGEGWSYPESRDGEAFAWGIGERSVLEFTLDRPRTLELGATAWSFGYPGAPRQEVAVRVNGTRVGKVAFDRGWDPRQVAIILPRTATAAGGNRIELLYRSSQRPDRVMAGSVDKRPLAVAWADLRLDPAPPRAGEAKPAASGARAPEAGKALLLPYGSAVSFYLRLPEGGELRVGRISPLEGSAGRLMVEVASGGRELGAESRSGGAGRSGLRLAIPAAPAEPVRMTLRAVGAGAGAQDGSLRLGSPRLLVPRSSAAALAAPEPAAVRPAEEAAAEPRRPNVLIYLVDTLRADHLGCYGYARDLSPNIDRLAADGVRFTHVVAQTSWTRPAVASVLTGLTPRRHDTNGRKDALPAALPVLPELLRELGYETAGFSTNGNVSAAFGFDRGFDRFVSLPEEETADVHQLSDRLHQAALEWLRERSSVPGGERPFALYLHASDPHYPYTPREDLRRRWAPAVTDPELGSMRTIQALRRGQRKGSPELAQALIDLYDAEIAFNDETFGELMEELGAAGWADSTVVVFLGDHGEEFMEHGGWTHGETLYQEQLAVPLIFRLPEGYLPQGRGRGRVVDAVARQVDVLPTLLDLLGEEPPAGLDGRSLLPWIAGGEEAGDATGKDRTGTASAWLDLDGWRLEAIVEGDWKLIHNLRARQGAGGTAELYDLGGDPGELTDLSGQRRNWRGYLLASLRAARLGAGPAARAREAEIDPELESRLRALGYLR